MGSQPLILLDTHVVVWWVAGDQRLSARARRAIKQHLRNGPALASSISVFEIVTAVRRGRLELALSLDQWLADLNSLPELRFEPVSTEIAKLAAGFDDAMPGDPADRIIVATAKTLGAGLITADDRLLKCPLVAALW